MPNYGSTNIGLILCFFDALLTIVARSYLTFSLGEFERDILSAFFGCHLDLDFNAVITDTQR